MCIHMYMHMQNLSMYIHIRTPNQYALGRPQMTQTWTLECTDTYHNEEKLQLTRKECEAAVGATNANANANAKPPALLQSIRAGKKLRATPRTTTTPTAPWLGTTTGRLTTPQLLSMSTLTRSTTDGGGRSTRRSSRTRTRTTHSLIEPMGPPAPRPVPTMSILPVATRRRGSRDARLAHASLAPTSRLFGADSDEEEDLFR
uniref:Uncharacterized protein n=1 Tax=Lotharella globosa TaxID=91324 RepID=A0A7S3YV94_9EUKA